MQKASYALDSSWRPLLKDLGASMTSVLRRAELPSDLLARPAVRLDTSVFHRFWIALEEELADPLLPLRFCRALRSETFTPLLFAALCSPNLLVAVRRIATYKALVAPMRLDLHETTQHLTLTLTWPDRVNQPPASLVATELLFFVALARMGTRDRVRPVRLSTPVPPMPARPYTDFLGIAIRAGRRHEIAFSKADAVRPFFTANDQLWSAFEPALQLRRAEIDANVTVEQRVRTVLLEALPSGLSDMTVIAQRLAMSRRTLQRRLQDEGKTYHIVLRETRESLARHYLRNTAFPLVEIAFLLGFEEPNSFYRAFRRWTDQTPDRLRQRAQVARLRSSH